MLFRSHLTISLNLVNLCCRCSLKFSLSGRDGDSNRFLSSWRGIPNTNPASPIRVAIKSPLAQLRRNKRKVAGPDSSTFSENHSAKVVRDSNPPWTYANGSPHILTTSRMHVTARVPGLSQATRLRGRNDLSGQLSVRLRSESL